MTLKEWIRFIYGLTMGTSTPLLKPTKRYLFPVARHVVDEGLSLLMGGSGICAILKSADEILLINTNQSLAARELRRWVDELGAGGRLKVVLNSTVADFSGGLELFAEADQIFVGGPFAPASRHAVESMMSRVETVREERTIDWAGEKIRLLPLAPSATDSDLAIYLESRSTLCLGPAFFNRFHPLLHPEQGLDAKAWLAHLQGLVSRFEPKLIIPAEGELATLDDLKLFIRYLRDLSDPSVEFSYCRKNYDWPEIPSLTSLEENFDLLHDKVKSHTRINS